MNGERSSGVLKRLLVLAVVLAAAVLLVIGIRHWTRTVILVRVAHPVNGDIVSSVSTNGKVEPVELFQAHASTPGQVRNVFVQPGAKVSAGTLLLKLDTAQAQARVQTALSSVVSASAAEHDVAAGGTQDERIGLRGDLDRAKLQATQAQQDLLALQQLQAKGAASPAEVQAAQQRLATAQSSVQSLQQRSSDRYGKTDLQKSEAQLRDSRAGLAAAQQDLANSIVRTPISGTVFSLPVRQYEFVQAGEELVQVADLSRMQVRAYFDEPEIGKLHNGDTVRITWDARPGKLWHGHIARVPTTVITYGTRNVGECLVSVDDATGDLLPNTNVNASVTTQQVRGVLTIPREALRTMGSSNFVYVLQKGRLQKRPVQVGALNLTAVQVTAGLDVHDTVALNATSNMDLSDGLQVEVAH